MKSITKIIFISILITTVFSIFPFEKKVWAFWTNQINTAPLIIQICHQKIQRFSKLHNYQFITLTRKNIQRYIPNYRNQFLKVFRNSQRKRKTQQALSDLVRIAIIQEHGGIYFDLSTILFNDFNFKWIENLNNYQNLIINKFNQNPQVLFFTIRRYQSGLLERNQQGILVNGNPGFQIWFIAAKKKAKLMTDWKNNYFNFTQIGFNNYNKLFSDQNIFIKYVDIVGYYWSANMALYYTIQKKQKQLDKQIKLNNLLAPRINANSNYKIWGLQGQHGPLIFSQTKFIFYDFAFSHTLQQLEEISGKILFFVKLDGSTRRFFDGKLQKFIKFKNSKDFYNIFQKKRPNLQNCNLLDVVMTKGSLFHKQLIQNNQFTKKYNLPTLTIQQRNLLRQKCKKPVKQQQNNYLDFILKQSQHPIQSYSKILKVRDTNNYSLFQYISKQIQYNHFMIDYIKYFLIQSLKFLILLYFSYIIPYLIFGILFKCLKIIKKENNTNTQSYFQLFQRKIIILFCILIRLVSVIYGLVIFYCLDQFSYIPLIFQTEVYLVFLIFQSKLIKILIKKDNTQFFGKNLISLCEIPINYFICFSILSIIQNRYQFIIIHCIFISLIGPSIYSIGLSLYQNNQNVNKLLKILIFNKGYHKVLALLFLGVIIYIPNLRFIVYNDKYLITYIIHVAFLYISLIFIGVGYELLRKQRRTKDYNKALIGFIFLICPSLFLNQICLKILTIKFILGCRIYNLSLVIAFSYAYLVCNQKIRQYSQNKQNRYNNIIIKIIEIFLVFSSLFYYIFKGTYYEKYDKIATLSLYQAIGFIINMGIFIGYQRLLTRINININNINYQQIELNKIQNFQTQQSFRQQSIPQQSLPQQSPSIITQ